MFIRKFILFVVLLTSCSATTCTLKELQETRPEEEICEDAEKKSKTGEQRYVYYVKEPDCSLWWIESEVDTALQMCKTHQNTTDASDQDCLTFDQYEACDIEEPPSTPLVENAKCSTQKKGWCGKTNGWPKGVDFGDYCQGSGGDAFLFLSADCRFGGWATNRKEAKEKCKEKSHIFQECYPFDCDRKATFCETPPAGGGLSDLGQVLPLDGDGCKVEQDWCGKKDGWPYNLGDSGYCERFNFLFLAADCDRSGVGATMPLAKKACEGTGGKECHVFDCNRAICKNGHKGVFGNWTGPSPGAATDPVVKPIPNDDPKCKWSERNVPEDWCGEQIGWPQNMNAGDYCDEPAKGKEFLFLTENCNAPFWYSVLAKGLVECEKTMKQKCYLFDCQRKICEEGGTNPKGILCGGLPCNDGSEPGDGGDGSEPGDGGDGSEPGDGGGGSKPGDGGDGSKPGDGTSAGSGDDDGNYMWIIWVVVALLLVCCCCCCLVGAFLWKKNKDKKTNANSGSSDNQRTNQNTYRSSSSGKPQQKSINQPSSPRSGSMNKGRSGGTEYQKKRDPNQSQSPSSKKKKRPAPDGSGNLPKAAGKYQI